MSEQDHLAALLSTLDQADAQMETLIALASLPLNKPLYDQLRAVRMRIDDQAYILRYLQSVGAFCQEVRR